MAPFTIHIMNASIDIITTPPLQVYDILKAQARKHHDGVMIMRMLQDATEECDDETDRQATLEHYAHGVDWELIRSVLRNKDRALAQVEVHTLEIVVTGAFWPEARRWKPADGTPASAERAHAADVSSPQGHADTDYSNVTAPSATSCGSKPRAE